MGKIKPLRKIILLLILSIITLIMSGCSTSTFWSPIRNQDIQILAGHKRYPLKVAVVAEEYTFTPDPKRGSYFYLKNSSGHREKIYHSHKFHIIPACRDFFPRIFDEVDFYDSLTFDQNKHDLIVSLHPTSVTDKTNNSEVSAELTFDISVSIRSGDKLLWKKGFESTGHGTGGASSEKRQDKKHLNYFLAANSATRGVFILLGRYLSSHPNAIDEHVSYLASLKQKETEKNTAPADLVAAVEYSDTNSILPNNIIDAGESSIIHVKVLNTGKGTAFDTKLETGSNYGDLEFVSSTTVGDIPPGESKEVTVAVKAGLDLKDGTVLFSIQAKEKRGYDSKQYNLNVPAAHLHKPEIVIVDYKINDGNAGRSIGNGNGIPENGETIELIPFVANTGVGQAVQVNLSIASIDGGITVIRRNETIPRIHPGATATGTLSFSIPRTFSSNTLNIQLAASDVRGASDAERRVALATESHRPVLAYSYKLLDRNGREISSVRNGEEGEVEITPLNKGGMEAREILLEIESAPLSFSRKQARIERIASSSSHVPQRFPFRVPRTLAKESVDVSLTFSQKDFPGLTDHINIPVTPVIPDFEIVHQIVDPNNNGAIEQGERVDIVVNVRNTGGLDADDVSLALDMNTEGVILLSEKELAIGKIPSGGMSEAKRFTVHVQRRAAEGPLPLRFTVSQKDFQGKDIPLALAVAKEHAEIITVAGKQQSDRIMPTGVMAYQDTAPVIALASPRDKKRVASASEILTGTVVDDKGIADIQVFVNGKRLETVRSIAVVAKPGTSQKEREFRAQIPLQKGANEITVTAFDVGNLSSTKSVTVFRESEKGEIWAAVIGINRYRNPNISLKYARDDAKAFADYLRNNMGLDDQHLFELYDDEASLREIRSMLGTKLRRKADSPEDTVFIFYAGHGAPLEDTVSKDGDGMTKYILPYDAELEDIYSSALPMDEIARIFSGIRAERVIFIADSCYSGGAGGRTILSQGHRANISDAFLDRIAQAGRGRIILTSSNANEVSQESDKLRHGYFTYYLLEGLKGKADLDGDRLIDVDEIYRYLNREVPNKTNGAQHPVKKGEAEGHVIVGRVE